MIKRFSLMGLLLVTGLVAGIVLSGTTDDRDEVLALPNAELVAEQPAAAPAIAATGGVGGPDFTRVAAQTVKAVTNISSVQVGRRRQASPFANDPFFQYFFGDQGEMFGQPRAESSALRVYIKSLREKLEPDPARPRSLVTEAGVGYRLELAE